MGSAADWEEGLVEVMEVGSEADWAAGWVEAQVEGCNIRSTTHTTMAVSSATRTQLAWSLVTSCSWKQGFTGVWARLPVPLHITANLWTSLVHLPWRRGRRQGRRR